MRPFTVNYRETYHYSVAVMAEDDVEAVEIADECVQVFGFEHEAISRSDYLDCEVTFVENGLTDSQFPYVGEKN